MKKVQLLIIGVTVLGTAAALKTHNAMVVDGSMLLGAEFVHSYKKTRVDMSLVNDVMEFSKPLESMNVLSDDGYVHLFPVSGVLAKLLEKAEVPVRFFSTVFDVSEAEGGFVVKLANKNGIETIFAEKILDTTSTGTMHGLFGECEVSKSICGLLSGTVGADSEEYSFVRGRFESENILELKVSEDCSFSEARIRLNRLWQRIHKSYPETRFATCAQRFSYEFPEPVCKAVVNGWIWKPSVSYGDIFSAFKEGIECCIPT